jgi:membrane associated rhomboid family serine protease
MRNRRYFFELGGALVLYGVLLVIANMIDWSLHPEGAVRIAVALMPMIGAVAAAWAIMRAIWRMDELQRRIQLDAIAMAFLATALITFGWGFLLDAGVPPLPAHAVWPMMGVGWMAGLLIARRRYR